MHKNIFLATCLVLGVVDALKPQHRSSPDTKAVLSDPAIFANNLQQKQDSNNINSSRTKNGDRQVDLNNSSSSNRKSQSSDQFQSNSSVNSAEEDILDQIGSTCSNNTQCDGSTFCCSKGRCVPGSICYKGQKQAYDHCDYGFECLSRCCASDVCSPVIQCVESCSVNSDCSDEPCCSFGYCTGSASICLTGMKEDFDQCEAAEECQSGKCSNGRCTSNEIQVSSQVSLNVMIILVFIMLIIVVTTCYYSKVKSDRAEKENNYRRQRRDRDGGERPDNYHSGSPNNDSRRRRHRRDGASREASSSQERRERRRDSQSRQEDSPNRDERGGRRSRGLSDSNGQPSGETLNKENLDRLGRQANSAKHGSGGGENNRGEPALLFVEDDHMNQYTGSSFMTNTNPRSSAEFSRAEGRTSATEGPAFSQDAASGTEREKGE